MRRAADHDEWDEDPGEGDDRDGPSAADVARYGGDEDAYDDHAFDGTPASAWDGVGGARRRSWAIGVGAALGLGAILAALLL